MKDKYGHESIEVSCIGNFKEKQITMSARTLVVLDEADAAFIDRGYKIEGS